ncbi:Xaa-Pro peptidase family protein [soil metagenome]
MPILTISPTEYSDRRDRLRDSMESKSLDAYVVFHPIRIAYLTGFFHQITERPVVLVLTPDGRQAMLVPRLEQEHVASIPGIHHVATYPEYPTGGTIHPMRHLGELLDELNMSRPGLKIGYDNDGPLDMNGYRGSLFSNSLADGVRTKPARELIDNLRAVKSDAEIALIAESCRWADVAHRRMHDAIAVGRNELEIAHEASFKASMEMLAALGPDYQAPSRSFFQPWCGLPAMVYLISGARTALPHGLPNASGIQAGDLLVTYAGTDIGGYQSELERTMIVGEPSAQIRESFNIMLQLQSLAFEAVRPGRRLRDVEAEMVDAFESLGVGETQRHHTGHGIGMEGHEAPFIDLGDDAYVQEGMVFTIEPGVYIPGFAGFRHSDTVVVRANGSERLTAYPRELDDLIVPA